ncbi:MAG: DHA2 family efflux MFS transporter permease subunit [Candidatus Cohnella colombiensis]|uniref:DHA2 family efflux MFS transporter permease subunit n=1 Tax=Candidatus Cohnella colombiensis TaxID=3121368 RepID=A0AA95EWB7_9BACL|nr:MAG: DHA2 family efflux MFS transporter permease subunit [Cohnella sp.]
MTEKSEKGVNKAILIAIILAGAFVLILNQTLLNTALPHIMSDLSIAATTGQWLITGFMLVNGVLIPISAFFISKFSSKNLFIAAMSFFALGTLVGATAQGFEVLFIGRILQACGAGIMMPLIQTMLLMMFPPEKRGAVMGLVGLVIAFAPAIGPTLAGWVLESYEWRALFYMMLPVVLIVIVLAQFVMKKETKHTNPKIDILSILLSTIGFSGLLYGFSSSGRQGWDSPEVWITIAVGAISLIVFTWRQFVIDTPLLHLRVFQNKTFSLSVIIGMVVMICNAGTQLLIPLYMQTARGYTALESGLMILPGAIVMGIMSPITGRIFDKIGLRPLAITGLSIAAVTAFLFSNITESTSYTYMVVVYAVLMFGISMIIMPIMTVGINQLKTEMIPHGTAVNNTLRTVAASIGMAILITIMSNKTNEAVKDKLTDPMVHGISAAFSVVASVAVVALVLSFFVKGKKGVTRVKKAA